jgi:hypothetical protein
VLARGASGLGRPSLRDPGVEHGVMTIEVSTPPDTRIGAVGQEVVVWADGTGDAGGKMASERTSCVCSRREVDWIHLGINEDDFVEDGREEGR